MIFGGCHTGNCAGHDAIDPGIKFVRMLLAPLTPRVGDHGNQPQRDIEKRANETEPLSPLIGPRGREVEPSKRRRDNASIDAEPTAMKGFYFTAGAARADLAATHAL